MRKRPVAVVAGLALAAALAGGGPEPAVAQAQKGRSWPEEKCDRYKKAWSDALVRKGRGGLGRAFLESHDAFLASGCTARADVCPRSGEEIEMANVMTILAMNAGTASTFLPFYCRN